MLERFRFVSFVLFCFVGGGWDDVAGVGEGGKTNGDYL